MFKRILLLLLVTFSQISFANFDKEFKDLFRNAAISRAEYRKASNREYSLLKQLEIKGNEHLFEEYKAERKQVAAYDRDYSEKINDLLSFLRRHPEYIKKLIDNFYIEEKNFYTGLSKNEAADTLNRLAARISITSYLLQEYYNDTYLSDNTDLSNLCEKKFEFLRTLRTAQHFARNEEEHERLVKKAESLKNSLEKIQRLVNPHAFLVKDLISINYTIHQILALSGRNPSRYDYSQLKNNLIFTLKEKDSVIWLALEIIEQQWKGIQSQDPLPTYKYLGISEAEKSFHSERTQYIRFENQDILEPIYLPMQSLDRILSEVSEYFEFMLDGLYQEKIKKKLNPDTLDHIVHLKKNRPEKQVNVPFGKWEISISNDYYIKVEGPNLTDSQKKVDDTYDAMQKGLEVGIYELANGVRSFLKNGGKDPELDKSRFNQARLSYAKFVSEPARNFKTWVVNLMILDLMEIGVIKNIDEFFRLHPMQGGSYKHQSFNSKDQEIVRLETLIFVNWIRHFWPRVEAVNFTNEVDLTYFKNVQSKSESEEYYYNSIIQMLFHRLKSTDSFTEMDFKLVPNDLGYSHVLPPRLLREYLYSGILEKAKGDESKAKKSAPLYHQYSILFDEFSIKSEAKSFLEEMIQKSAPDLKEFWIKKLADFESKIIEPHRLEYVKTISEIHKIEDNRISFEQDSKEKNESLSSANDIMGIFRNLQFNSRPRRLLASHNGITSAFTETLATTHNNNCAFDVLGITRERAIEQLLENARNPYIRQLVADDIVSALVGDELPARMRSEFTDDLLANYLRYSHFVNTQPENRNPAEDNQQLNEIVQQMRSYANQEDTYRNFIGFYLQEQPGMLSYIREGHGLLDAVAELNGLEVNVWVRNEEDENTLHRIHYYRSVNTPFSRLVNMHHTWGMTHFNHLQAANIDEAEAPNVYANSREEFLNKLTPDLHSLMLGVLFIIHHESLSKNPE